MSKTNPADTLAALAADIERAGQAAPFILDNTAFAISPSEIDGWISRLRALASLKGEAEPVAWGAYRLSMGVYTATSDNHRYINRVYGDDADYRIDPLYTTPPAPQAVGEAINWPLVREGLDYFDRAGDAGDKLYVAEIRKALGQPAPAPQGGGEAAEPGRIPALIETFRERHYRRELNSRPQQHEGKAVTVESLNEIHDEWLKSETDQGFIEYLYDALATPPAQQPGEVGEAIRRMDECRAGCDAGDPFYADAAAWDTIRAFLAPKEKGK